jgi:hypothetical protein
MIQILLFALFPIALAQYGSPYGAPSYKVPSYEPQYPPQPYKFGYDVKDGYGSGLNQKEEGDSYGNKKGSYGYTDGYGIYRQVDYVADEHGFRATVKTNEPGTANQDPADVYIQSSAAPADYAPAPYKAPSYGIPSYAPSYAAPSYKIQSYGYEQPRYLPEPIYKAPSYSAPIYSAPKLSYGGQGGYGGYGGYSVSHSIPTVAYAKGY